MESWSAIPTVKIEGFTFLSGHTSSSIRHPPIKEYYLKSFIKAERFQNRDFKEVVVGGDIVFDTAMIPLEPASHPELETPYCLYLSIIRAV
jgi:hypothetical protein